MVEQNRLAHGNPGTDKRRGVQGRTWPQSTPLVVYILQVGSIFLQFPRALRRGLGTKCSPREPVRDISPQPVIAFSGTMQPEDTPAPGRVPQNTVHLPLTFPSKAQLDFAHLRLLFIILIMRLPVCLRGGMPCERGCPRTPETGATMDVSYLLWVLGTRLRSSAKTEPVLNC